MEFRQSGDFVFFVSEGGEETFMGLKKKSSCFALAELRSRVKIRQRE